MKKFLIAIGILLVLSGCGSPTSGAVKEVEPIIDVTQFSRITPEELKVKLGEPVAEYDEKWTNPGTGEEFDMKSYDYEVNGYYTEFLVIDSMVVRMNVFASDKENNEFVLNKNKDIFNMIEIEPRESLIIVADNDMVARYSSVSDRVGEVWAIIDNKEVETLKVTYNLNYFN